MFVLNVVDGCIPSDMATGSAEEIEEERRLLYVAMTRAKDQLHLIVPQRFYVHGQARRGDKHLYASRTRFIPAGILGAFHLCRVAARGAIGRRRRRRGIKGWCERRSAGAHARQVAHGHVISRPLQA